MQRRMHQNQAGDTLCQRSAIGIAVQRPLFLDGDVEMVIQRVRFASAFCDDAENRIDVALRDRHSVCSLNTHKTVLILPTHSFKNISQLFMTKFQTAQGTTAHSLMQIPLNTKFRSKLTKVDRKR